MSGAPRDFASTVALRPATRSVYSGREMCTESEFTTKDLF